VSATIAESTPRSTFVTVVGWQGIVFASVGLAATTMQVLMLWMMGGFSPTAANVVSLGLSAYRPALSVWGTPAACVLALGASIGLLRRRPWARWTLVVLLAIAVVLILASLTGSLDLLRSAHEASSGSDAELERVMRLMGYYWMFVATSSALVLAWIIKRLCAKSLRAEFRSGAELRVNVGEGPLR
jgi:hypothetical protein